MQLKFILISLILLVACAKEPDKESLQKEEITVIASEYNRNTSNVCSNFDLGRFIGSIGNIPSPTSNLKYVAQTNNIFEVNYGDGIYYLISKETAPIRISCDSGDSMLPTFDCDDTVILKEVESPDEIYIGDIILYRHNDGRLILHRLFRIIDGKYQTKGDNMGNAVTINNELISSDSPVNFDQIMAKVVGIIYK